METNRHVLKKSQQQYVWGSHKWRCLWQHRQNQTGVLGGHMFKIRMKYIYIWDDRGKSMTKNEAKAILWYAYHLIILNRWWTGVYRLGWASKCLLPVGLPNSLHKLHYPLPHIWVWGNIDEWKQTCIHCNTTTRINRFYILFIYVYIYIYILISFSSEILMLCNEQTNE